MICNYSKLVQKTLLLCAFALSSSAFADTSMIGTETGYSLRKKDRKTIIITTTTTTTTTTTIYEKKSGKPGTIKKIITEVKQINDRKNKKSYTETKVTKTEKPLKKKRREARLTKRLKQ